MIYSEKWLREWLQTTENVEQIARVLTMGGLEVESYEPVAAEFSNVFVAEVLSSAAHPNADKLKVCQVTDGSDTFQIVCGAPNARAGIKVALAKVGAVLPGDFKIKESKIRDEVSFGMLCSSKELKLGNDHDGILELSPDAVNGTPFADYLDLNDTLVEIDLTPNRGDCLSIAGIAREAAALLPAEFTPPEAAEVKETIDNVFPVELQSPEDCPRYCCRIIKNVDLTKRLPVFISERIRRSGVKSINPVVDLTNYVMLETGQPMHAFDLDKLSGKITVRRGQNEKMVFLDGKEALIDDRDLVIADDKGAVALAGVIGGLDSGVTAKTTNILLESAFFTPDIIMGRARRYGLHTDASHRYERGVDPDLQKRAADRLANLIMQYLGGDAGPMNEAVEERLVPVKQPVDVFKHNCQRILGVEVSVEEMKDYLSRLGCQAQINGDAVRVVAPSYRFDLNGEHDFIEEVARIYGYDKIPVSLPVARAGSNKSSELKIEEYRLKAHMISNGYNEVISYSFVDEKEQEVFHPREKAIPLANPISENMGVMRLSLITGLLSTLVRNQRHQQKNARLFEIGNRYFYQDDEIKEQRLLAGMVTGEDKSPFWCNVQNQSNMIDFYSAKGDVEVLFSFVGQSLAGPLQFKAAQYDGFHPYQCADVFYRNKRVGFIGRILSEILEPLDIDQPVFYYQLDINEITTKRLPQYQPVSRFPAVNRDLAFVIDETVTAAEMTDLVREFGGPMLQDVSVFDVYQGKGVETSKKSLALTMTFQGQDKTLDENELETYISNIINGLKDKLNANLRD